MMGAKKTLEEYLKAWKGGKPWDEYVEWATTRLLVQRSFVTRPPGTLEAYVVSTKVEKVSPVMADVLATLTIDGTKNVYRFRLVREDADGPSTAGTWGVNPASMRRVTNDEPLSGTTRLG